jgi:hypothetical protein
LTLYATSGRRPRHSLRRLAVVAAIVAAGAAALGASALFAGGPPPTSLIELVVTTATAGLLAFIASRPAAVIVTAALLAAEASALLLALGWTAVLLYAPLAVEIAAILVAPLLIVEVAGWRRPGSPDAARDPSLPVAIAAGVLAPAAAVAVTWPAMRRQPVVSLLGGIAGGTLAGVAASGAGLSIVAAGVAGGVAVAAILLATRWLDRSRAGPTGTSD